MSAYCGVWKDCSVSMGAKFVCTSTSKLLPTNLPSHSKADRRLPSPSGLAILSLSFQPGSRQAGTDPRSIPHFPLHESDVDLLLSAAGYSELPGAFMVSS